MVFVSAFLRQAEEILDVAAGSASAAEEFAIVVDGRGSFRMMDGGGWTLAGLSAEFGAAAVFRVERRGRMLRVEGLSGPERCLLQRDLRGPTPLMAFRHALGWSALLPASV